MIAICSFLYKILKKKNIIKKLYQQRKNKSDILDILVLIKSNISANKSKLKQYSDITSFSLEYFNTTPEFFARNDISNNEVRYANDFCLSYIALIGFRNVFVDLEEDEIFIFQSEKYSYFSEFLNKYNILTDIKNFYEKYSNEIKVKYYNDKNLYLYLIIRFDSSFQFYQKLIEDKKTHQNSEYKNGVYIQENSGKETKNLIINEQDNNKSTQKSKNNLTLNKGDDENIRDKLIINKMSKNSKIIELAQKQNENDEINLILFFKFF